jgi:glutamate-1-semialdehyde 2,1-aminomutase
LPGGVNSPVRAMRAIGRDPIFIDRGAGAEIVDVDGNATSTTSARGVR